ncbi:Hsp70 family protein [Brachybacterium sp. UNK5269]|uniref:Hsp70 family protein n=1 Tax=Brachybacterium sp. UNK5269 TaxID=3408576 RepID=UPI003BB08FFD
MRIGIDIGTTRTIAAGVDRGNYPVLSFLDPDGDAHDHFPSVIALVGDRLVHGFSAERAARAGAPHLRSFKRLLGDPAAHPGTTVELGGRSLLLLDLLTEFLIAVRAALPVTAEQVAVSVPAHAHSAQRIMTLEAFRRAGFEVIAMVNEPSAAGFEYTHRQGRSLTARRSRIAVYDLGGGTFDGSLLEADGTSHAVLDTRGENRLGGDDFDQVLADLALEKAGLRAEDLGADALAALREQSRTAKESLVPQSRRVMVELPEELDREPVVLAVEDFYAAAAPLVTRTLELMEPLVGELDQDSAIAGVYLVGGGSGLPLVGRMLRERYGRRVHRSAHPAASTAIGLAIAADPDSGFTMSDRLSRGFGVFRESRAGEGVAFDPIFTRDAALPEEGRSIVTRRYRAAHNLGWFRFVEHAAVDAAGEPRGDLIPYAEVLFPFDPALQTSAADLTAVPVERRADGPEIEESYTVDPAGIVTVHLTDLSTGFSRSYGLLRRS